MGVPLQHDRVLRRGVPVHAEAQLGTAAAVVAVVGTFEILVPLREDPVVDPVARLPTIAKPQVIGPVAADDRRIQPLGSSRVARDDVDDAVHGIGAPKRRAGAGNDFDPLHIFRQYVRHVPIYAGIKRRINAAAVDKDQQLVGKILRLFIAAKAAGSDDYVIRAAPHHLQIGREPQYARQGQRT
ncbi:hypothetical protein EP837_02652 [Sphingobium sp. EP60837]|nr:hypothetical protein EP837_02652 [Sphingobium sp. EP60837]